MRNKQFIAAFWPALSCLALITGLSVLPSVPLPRFDLFSPDKLGHALAYGALVWLVLRGWRQWRGAVDRRTGLLAFAFAGAYGVAMEFVQGAFIPGRFYEYDDMLANIFGAALAWFIFTRKSLA